MHVGFKIHSSSCESTLGRRISRIRWTEYWTDGYVLEEIGTDQALTKIFKKIDILWSHYQGTEPVQKNYVKGKRMGGKGKNEQEDYCEWDQAMDSKEASRMHNFHMPQQDGES